MLVRVSKTSRGLSDAKKEKDNEFYTRVEDVESFLLPYAADGFFQGMNVFCNCNDGDWSEIFKFFARRFDQLGLKSVSGTLYPEGKLIKKVNSKEDPEEIDLKGNGSYDSEECIELAKNSDLIITNPPFSEMKGYYAMLKEVKTKFMVILPRRIVSDIALEDYMAGKLHIRSNCISKYTDKNKQIKKGGDGAHWFTNVKTDHRPSSQKDVISFSKYKGNEDYYPKILFTDIIFVKYTNRIPIDYDGLMGVPLSYIVKHNPDNYKILGTLKGSKIPRIKVNMVENDGKYFIPTDIASKKAKPMCLIPYNAEIHGRDSIYCHPETKEILKSGGDRFIITKRV